MIKDAVVYQNELDIEGVREHGQMHAVRLSDVEPLGPYDEFYIDNIVPRAYNMLSGFLLNRERPDYPDSLLLPVIILAGLYKNYFFIEIVPIEGTEPTGESIRFSSVLRLTSEGIPAHIPDSLFQAESFLAPRVKGYEEELHDGLLGFIAVNMFYEYYGGDIGSTQIHTERLYQESRANMAS